MKKRLLLGLALSALPLFASARHLTVSAAASLTDAFKEIGPRFEASRHAAAVRFNFAASGVLLQQIVQGAPADVFVSADQETMNRGVKQKVIAADSRRDFASNSLVLITATGSLLKTVRELDTPEVKRIAVGKVASVPVGRYTQQALENAQLWAGLQPKFVFADNVRQVLDYVSRGEVEAGFVYRTDAEIAKGKVRIALMVGGHSPVTYPAAVVSDSGQAALARDFVAYLSGAEAQAILAKYGFGKP